MDEGNQGDNEVPPQGEPVRGFPMLQFFGHQNFEIGADRPMLQFLRGLLLSQDDVPECDVERSLVLDTYDPRTGRFRILATEKIHHCEECINNITDAKEPHSRARKFPDDVGIIPLDKTDISNLKLRDELLQDPECTVYLLGMLTLPTLAIYCTSNRVPVGKENRWLCGFVSYINPELISDDARRRVLTQACDIIENACRFQKEVSQIVSDSSVKFTDGSVWAREVFMKTDLLGLIVMYLDFTSFLRLLFMTNGPMRRWFLRQRAPSGASEIDRGAMRNRMRVLDFAQRIRDETGIEYKQGEVSR